MSKWRVCVFPSGSHIVTTQLPNCPWLYIYGPKEADELARAKARRQCCNDVCEYLNGACDRPAWFTSLFRFGETLAEAPDGTRIEAVGPMIDSNPPKLCWVQDDTDDAKYRRAALMDKIMLEGGRDD